jgi:D-alanyl-D-alanine carboxypeptidase
LSRKEIVDLSRLYEYSFETKNGRKKNINSTNELLLGLKDTGIKGNVIAGKTGYNDLAGYCLSLDFSLEGGQKFISVVLNSSSIKNRFLDTEKIAEKIDSIYK